jgi:threonine dehydratase
VLTGGNIDPRLLSSVILRGLVHDGRLSRLRVWLDDRPGSLSLLTAVVGEAGGNIVEVHHQRLFASAPIRSTEVELAIETMDREHADTLVRALEARGYRVSVVPMDTEPT